ncbi:hypothetical protein QRD02_07000 [Aequorivita sp. SDUM287046]|uniref:Uncharacterized protein n=1 Tax=Aequorivita aurantiaca TaxID=3053356 RepID=A0ABT8DHE2_9FLAO|nr:hypothetical protein [Aequorivita aurantiaca]MDN3724124.1 hypothetical protein [Aequorivita aurantiaca]
MEISIKNSVKEQLGILKKIKVFQLFFAFVSMASTSWSQNQNLQNITLSFSDGSADIVGVEKINSILKTIGVHVSTVTIPDEAKPLIKNSRKRALTNAEAESLISLFYLDRNELLEQIEKAGRKPEAIGGGFLSTKEEAMSPYPKVYDMKSLSPEVIFFLQNKFGKLHVNISDNGMGIDEVMTIVSGGPWTWFFVLPNNNVAKLTLENVAVHNIGWRISYPGLIPHGGFFDADYGLVVAFAHGPEKFEMKYEEPSVESYKWMGKNPWIDFSGKNPKLLDRIN